MYLDRVESKSNVSDEPSRGIEDNIMIKIGAKFVPPVLHFDKLLGLGKDPALWFGGESRWQELKTYLYSQLIKPNQTHPH